MRAVMLVSALIGIFSTSAPAEDIDLEELIDVFVEAYGGREALAEFPGYRARGKLMSVADGVNGKVRLLVTTEGSMRAAIHYPSREEVRILSGGAVWNGSRHEQSASRPAMATSVRLQYHRLVAPFELAAASLEDLELVGADGSGWVGVRRRWSSSISMVYEIEPETGLIRRTRGELVTGEDEVLEFVTDAQDFREVEGVPFPFRMTTWVGDEVAAETILDRVTVEDDFSSRDFLPSGARDDL